MNRINRKYLRSSHHIDTAGCRPTRIWTIIRHGSRNPNRKTIKLMRFHSIEMRDNILRAQKTAATLCESDLALFRQWEPKLHEDDQKKLVLEGADELLNMAERMQNRFPKLLSDTFTNTTYRVYQMLNFSIRIKVKYSKH